MENSTRYEYNVEKLIKHKRYASGLFGDDIGLIRVEGTIEFNSLVQPIEYSKEKVEANSTLQLSNYDFVSVRTMTFGYLTLSFHIH